MNDVLNQLDLGVKEQILKAAEILSTDTFSPPTRSVFAPENITEDIKVVVPTETVLRNRFPRVQGYGQAAVFKRLTSKLHGNTGAAGVGTNTGVAFADASAPSETDQTYETVAYPFKLLGRKVEVGGLAIAATRNQLGNNPVVGGANMLDSRERTKAVEVMIGEEELLIGGDTNTDSNQFDGLGKQITTYSGNAALLTASGIGTFCNTLWNGSGGNPTVLAHNARQGRAIADNLEWNGSIQRAAIANTGNVTVGYKVANVINPVTGRVIDTETSRYVGGNAYLLQEQTDAGDNCIQIEELIPMSRIDVPSSNFSQIRFIVEALVLEVIYEPMQMTIGGLAIG